MKRRERNTKLVNHSTEIGEKRQKGYINRKRSNMSKIDILPDGPVIFKEVSAALRNIFFFLEDK